MPAPHYAANLHSLPRDPLSVSLPPGSLPEAPGQALLLPLSSPDPLVMRPGGIQPKTFKVSPVNKSLGALKALTGPDCDEGADNPAVLCRLPCDDMDRSSEKHMRGEVPKPPSPAADSR